MTRRTIRHIGQIACHFGYPPRDLWQIVDYYSGRRAARLSAMRTAYRAKTRRRTR